MAAIEAIDPAELSAEARFERDIELHNVRRALFDLDVAAALGAPLVRADDGRRCALPALRPRPRAAGRAARRDRRPARGRRGLPRGVQDPRDRPAGPPWQELEIEEAHELPGFFDEFVAAGTGVLAPPERPGWSVPSTSAEAAVEAYADWMRETLAGRDRRLGRSAASTTTTSWATAPSTASMPTQILELGWQKLAEQQAARGAAAREIDPDADEPRSSHGSRPTSPADFAGRSRRIGRRCCAPARTSSSTASSRSRTTSGSTSSRRPSTCTTSSPLRRISRRRVRPAPKGIYVVTPSVGDDPDAMREHNYASISNTSIHEAYPGHHLQLDAARRLPSLTRLLTDAPEFVEGWGMYSELLMREQGFDDDARFRVMLHTDAIWRACRIILDVRMHRGELTAEEATDFLVEQTGFQRANAAAEVGWYTYRPTYPLSYLLGRTLLLGLRDDEQRRLGDAFSLKRFHDTLLRNGSLPISFHRRALAGEGAVGR